MRTSTDATGPRRPDSSPTGPRRRIDWGLPDAEYGGSIVVEQGTPSTARVTVRLRTGEAADAAAVAKVFEASVSSIRRILTGR